VRGRVVRREAHRGRERLRGLRGAARGREQQAEVVAAIGVVRREFDRAPVLPLGAGDVAAVGEQVPVADSVAARSTAGRSRSSSRR
jgi:hypothetical protein